MSTRPTQLDKAIKELDVEIAVATLARDKLLAQRNKADLEAAHAPKLKTVAK